MSEPRWKIDATGSFVSFRARTGLLSEITGSVPDWSADLAYDPSAPGTLSVEAVARLASLTTGDEDRDRQIRSPECLDAARFPEVRVRSNSVELLGSTAMRVGCALTIGRVTRSTAFLVERYDVPLDMLGGHLARFTGHASINRVDWGMAWRSLPVSTGTFVGERVTLAFEIAAFRAPGAASGQSAWGGDHGG
ncbi:MAG: YceI family protein [Myxococcota bacterium]